MSESRLQPGTLRLVELPAASGRSGRSRASSDSRTRAMKTPRTRRTSTPTRREWIPSRDSRSVRWSKVLTAQARIAVGYYDRPDVKDLVLDAVLKELRRH